MKKKNIIYGLLTLLGIYLVTKKSDSDDSTGGRTSDVGNGSNDVERGNAVTDVSTKTPVVEVNSGGTSTGGAVATGGSSVSTTPPSFVY